MAALPSSQSPASSASDRPARGAAPVQLVIAVSRKPAIAAGTKPYSISCACHWLVNGRGAAICSRNATQRRTLNAPYRAASRKKERNPKARRDEEDQRGMKNPTNCTDFINMHAECILCKALTGSRQPAQGQAMAAL